MARQPRERWYTLAPHALTLTARTESISGTGNPSFLARRQEHGFATVETKVRYAPVRAGDRAGLAAFADEQHYYFFGVMQTEKGPAVGLSMRNGATDPASGRTIASTTCIDCSNRPVRLRIEAKGAAFDFSYAVGTGAWTKLVADADARPLASERSNQFTGVVVGVLAERSN
jgi:alpha-N-arabinofuranosidase